MKISVIIPAYNAEKYIRTAIEKLPEPNLCASRDHCC